MFDSGGKYKYKTGGNKLLGPKGLAVSGTGDLVVVDNKASCVHIVQPMGKVIAKFGSRGSGTAQFAGPHYAAVNSHNNIIISDFHNHNIKVFYLTFVYSEISHAGVYRGGSLHLQFWLQW